MLIVGEKEAMEGKISVRRHGGEDKGSMLLTDFVSAFSKEFGLPSL
jgi:threonyl-tRNA synthetase